MKPGVTHIINFGNRGLLFRVLLLSDNMEAMAIDTVYQIPVVCHIRYFFLQVIR